MDSSTRSALVAKEAEYGQQIRDRMEVAEARAKGHEGDLEKVGLPATGFNPAMWALAQPKDMRSDYGRPWEPLVQGEPTTMQCVLNFNMWEFVSPVAVGVASYAGLFAAARAGRVRSLTPHAIGTLCGVSLGAFQFRSSLVTSADRLKGWAPNGQPVRPGFEMSGNLPNAVGTMKRNPSMFRDGMQGVTVANRKPLDSAHSARD